MIMICIDFLSLFYRSFISFANLLCVISYTPKLELYVIDHGGIQRRIIAVLCTLTRFAFTENFKYFSVHVDMKSTANFEIVDISIITVFML
jgi:hypothetical protein